MTISHCLKTAALDDSNLTGVAVRGVARPSPRPWREELECVLAIMMGSLRHDLIRGGCN